MLPILHADRFKAIGIQPPKGVLLHGPPGTGKTLLARACANQTKAAFLKLAGPQLVQMYIGDGAKIVRDAFKLAIEKAPSIVFIGHITLINNIYARFFFCFFLFFFHFSLVNDGQTRNTKLCVCVCVCVILCMCVSN